MLLLLRLFAVVIVCCFAILVAQYLLTFLVVWHRYANTLKPPDIPAPMQELSNLQEFTCASLGQVQCATCYTTALSNTPALEATCWEEKIPGSKV